MRHYKPLLLSLILLAFGMLSVETSHAQLGQIREVTAIKLKKKSDIKDIMALDIHYTETLDKIVACKKTGVDIGICKCKQIEKLYDFQVLLSSTLSKHPNWRDQWIEYPVKGKKEHETVNTNLFMRQSDHVDTLQCAAEK